IDGNGRIIAELGYGEKGSITQSIEVMNARSLYLLFGRYLERILFLGIVFIAAVRLFMNISRKYDKRWE
ncbi:MAG: hypothetical protein GX759_02465, partial [Thermoanaerobacterales bacterium]|nr:hypothetical protein [Thermoanaerobacterales bacterium]